MKVCQVIGGAGRGGLEKHFVELCNHLADHHHVVAIAHHGFSDRLRPQVRFEPLDLTRNRRNPLAVFELFRVLRRHRPDLIHTHANKATAMVRALSPLLPAKRVATVHNLKKNLRMFRNCDRVIAVSPSIARALNDRHVEVIYNGIQPPRLPEGCGDGTYLRQALSLRTARPVVISVGRLVSAKGFDLLIQAWPRVQADLLILGEGPERPALEGLIQRLNLGDRVRLAGHREDVSALMAGCDLVVIPSRREGFSYVMAEALQVGRVVVSTRVPGPVDILPPEVLVPCTDPHALAQVVTRTMADLDRLHRVFAPVWDFARHELTVSWMTKKTESLYRRVLGGE